MYCDTTLQEAFSRGLKCHANDLPKVCIFRRLIATYLHEDYNSIFYGKAQNLGRVLCKAYDEALQKYDVLILPTMEKKAPVFPQEDPPLEGQILPYVLEIPCICEFGRVIVFIYPPDRYLIRGTQEKNGI